MCLKRLASAKLAVGTFALFFAVNSQASLVDCAKIPVASTSLSTNCITADSGQHSPYVAHHSAAKSGVVDTATHTGFQINPPQNAGAVPNSVPLIVFSIFLIVVLLIRAKSINSK